MEIFFDTLQISTADVTGDYCKRKKEIKNRAGAAEASAQGAHFTVG